MIQGYTIMNPRLFEQPEQDVVIRTQFNKWVIPHDCELLKTLLTLKRIQARDLRFNSAAQCQEFIKRLLLMAAGDEICQGQPSVLASMARDLIQLAHDPSMNSIGPAYLNASSNSDGAQRLSDVSQQI